MNSKMIGVAIAIFLAAVVFVLIATKPAQSGDALIYARGTDSTTFDPQEMSWGEDIKIAECLYETLVRFTNDPPNVEPHLAESYRATEDGLFWEFHLRKDVKFHDGTPFNAAAVVFTYERLLDDKHSHRPKTTPFAPFYTDLINSVTAKDGHTVNFELKKRSAVFLQLLAIYPAGIVSPEAVKKHAEQFPRKPVGTGPFKLSEWKTNEKITLVRNVDYWGTKPPLEKIIVVPYPNPQTAIQSLQIGDIHMMDHPTLADIRVLKESEGVQVQFATSPNVAYLAFNMNPEAPPYNDIHFRRAVAYAIDRHALNSQVYYGLAVPARNIVPPTLWSGEELPPYEHDMKKAREELAKVKLPTDFVAEVWHMNFPRSYMPEPAKVSEFIKARLEQIGLKVRIQTFEKASYTKKIKEKTHPMCLLGWMADYPDVDNFLNPILHGQFAGDLNISFWNNKQFNDLVHQGVQLTDPNKRMSVYFEASKIYRDEMPSVSLVHTRRIYALRNNVKFTPHPIDYRIYTASIDPRDPDPSLPRGDEANTK